MNDQPAQDPQPVLKSYVDDYTPPAPTDVNLTDVPLDDVTPRGGSQFTQPLTSGASDQTTSDQPASDQTTSDQPVSDQTTAPTDQPAQDSQPASDQIASDQSAPSDQSDQAVVIEEPPAEPGSQPESKPEETLVAPMENPEEKPEGMTEPSPESMDGVLTDKDLEGVSVGGDVSEEDLEAQNIFVMLGVDNGEENLKEKFLDQLQDVIWDDFLVNDVQLLLSEDEMVKFKTHKEKIDSAQGEAQEQARDELVEFLEGLIPDLEDIMLEKALDLKADLFVERINGMKEYFAEKPDQLAIVNQAETLMGEDKWKTAADTLNGIKE